MEERRILESMLQKFLTALHRATDGLLDEDDELRRALIVIDTLVTVVIGMSADDVLGNGFLAIDDMDFSEWLTRHGCCYPDSALARGIYDGLFSYENGDPALPRIAAGSALYTFLRLALTYRGAVMYWMNAGMGETIFSPIYLALLNRGVKFNFLVRRSRTLASPRMASRSRQSRWTYKRHRSLIFRTVTSRCLR